MAEIVKLKQSENRTQTRLVQGIAEAVSGLLEEMEGQVTYIDVCGALSIIKAEYELEFISLAMGD